MRNEVGLICAMLLLAGCVHEKQPAKPLPTHPTPTYITPHLANVGRVEMVNPSGRFVVLSFPPGRVPPAGQHWGIIHSGLKVGRVTITGPQREIDTVADLVEGEATVGDEAKPE